MNLSCLFCGYPIPIHSRKKLGEHIICSHCKTVFRLTSKTPFQIDWLEVNEQSRNFSLDGENYIEELE